MTYVCKSCGHSSSKVAKNGACIACNSFQIKSNKPKPSTQQQTQKTKLELAIMLLLWGLLAYGVYDRFFNT